MSGGDNNARSALAPRVGTPAEIRADFVRRLFAVAFSIGMATTLARMDWVQDGRLPESMEWEELAVLLTGVMLMVLSWDGYLISIYEKPLNRIWRYAIDILLVLVYMLFLLTARHNEFFLPLLAIIFWLYFAWDILSMLEYPRNYSESPPEHAVNIIDGIYWGGVLDRPKVKRGPVITLTWAIYFTALLPHSVPMNHAQVFANCVFSILGLMLYRWDKNRLATDLPDSDRSWKLNDIELKVKGFQMRLRVVIMIALLCAASVARCLLST